jgi:hypothetical protein
MKAEMSFCYLLKRSHVVDKMSGTEKNAEIDFTEIYFANGNLTILVRL